MGNIVILDEKTANQIAAGEVVERPASVIKELCENSIDAGSTKITVEIKKGGISHIKISDNGCGILEDDVEMAFERHATSKIRNIGDIDNIQTMGFRGEALASIASVSELSLATRAKSASEGVKITVHGGKILDRGPCGCPLGTSVTINNLFFNTPARYKFLKKDSTEGMYVEESVIRLALGNPHVSFAFINNGQSALNTPGDGDLANTVYSIFGRDVYKNIIKVDMDDGNFKVSGFIGKPEIARGNRGNQFLYINDRFIRDKALSSAVEEGYRTYLMKGKFPFFVLSLKTDPKFVDVNVHPQKLEVRFQDEHKIYGFLSEACVDALSRGMEIREVNFGVPDTAENKASIEVKKQIEENFEAANVVKPEIDHELEVDFAYMSKKENLQNVLLPMPSYYENKNDRKEQIYIKEPEKTTVYKITGIIFKTYIILESGGEMLMVDQHAAHERINYEKLKKSYSERAVQAQMLLVPVSVELTDSQVELANNNREYFESMGIIFESFGKNSLLIRSMPVEANEADVREAFYFILDKVKEENLKNDKTADEILFNIACKSSIKANFTLDIKEAEYLVNKLFEMDNPYTCPHGRPTVIKISKSEIEKKFKRIV